jgi:hypothetical protein
MQLPSPADPATEPAGASYQCSLCPRTYKTPESLSRHVKIHRESRDHVCSVCDVGFTRRDILLRHSRIHIGNQDAGSAGGGVSRLRSQRACDSCSRHRVKCDGLEPCGRCARTDRTCQYARTRLRHSKPVSSFCGTKNKDRSGLDMPHNSRPGGREESGSANDRETDLSLPVHASFADEAMPQEEYHGATWTPLTPLSATATNCPLPAERTFAQAASSTDTMKASPSRPGTNQPTLDDTAGAWSLDSCDLQIDMGNWQWLFDEVLFQDHMWQLDGAMTNQDIRTSNSSSSHSNSGHNPIMGQEAVAILETPPWPVVNVRLFSH